MNFRSFLLQSVLSDKVKKSFFSSSFSLLLTISCNDAKPMELDISKPSGFGAFVFQEIQGGSGISGPPSGPTNCSTHGPCYIFELSNITSALSDGNLGGVAGADAKCQMAASTLPSGFGSASDYKALLMDEGGGRNLSHNWVLHPNTAYLNINSVTLDPNDSLPVAITDANGMFHFPVTNSVVIAGGASSLTFTGIVTSGTLWAPGVARSCFDWTSTAVGTTYGEVGDTSSTFSFIDRGYDQAQTCDRTLSIYCVRY